MEDKLFLLMPSLQMLKYKLLGDNHLDQQGLWTSILLQEDDHYKIAFIINQNEKGFLSIYIPDAPKMEAGEIRYVHQSKCTYHDITMQNAMKALNSFGRDGELWDAIVQ